MDTLNTLPLLALRGLVVFPGTNVSFDVIRQASVKAIENALSQDKRILIVTQRNLTAENPLADDLYTIGCEAQIKQFANTGKSGARVMAEIKRRVKIEEFVKFKPYIVACYDVIAEPAEDDVMKCQAYIESVKESFEKYLAATRKLIGEKHIMSFSIKSAGGFADAIASNIECNFDIKQEILETVDTFERFEKLLIVIANETQIALTKKRIEEMVKDSMDENQREYYLREKLKVIEKELGDKDGFSDEIAHYRKAIKGLCFEKEIEEKLLKDTERLAKMQPSSPDSTVLRAYLDTVTELPWNIVTDDCTDIKRAEEILNSEHYGLEKVKERITEYLAVHSLTGGTDGTVLCLYGPPGTGKTSIAKSIAKSLDRGFARISLGGIHDEAEIRGHRKTYIGSMTGRIIDAIKQSQSRNPVILLDEIDKIGQDYKGDPSAALLEVLDFEQNSTFRDNYLEIPFDLSKVIFIATANDISQIPAPLYDRVEMLEVSGYTNQEKLEIAKRHLLPKQTEKNGLKGKRVTVTDDALEDIISYYTREAGVRELERRISELLRKVARVILSGEKKSAKISRKNLCNYLGVHKFSFDMKNNSDEVGTVRGLAWTSVGGDTLSVEANVMDGTGKIELTGNLGDVMKESAVTAVSYIRSKSDSLDIEKDFYKTKDIHIHVPEGAVPKDGPSAGITIATAVASALTGKPVRCDIAMTGEITLRGNVLPIGGLKEKSLAAYRAGIKTILIPDKNTPDIDEIPDTVREKIEFIPVKSMDAVLKNAWGNIR